MESVDVFTHREVKILQDLFGGPHIVPVVGGEIIECSCLM